MILGTLGAVEIGLRALGVPHRSGLEAAAAALAEAAGAEARARVA
jgi:hypothetical protein